MKEAILFLSENRSLKNNHISLKTKIIPYCLLITVMIIMIIHCERFELNRILKVSTGRVVNITAITAQAEATIIDVGPEKIICHGHCWSISPNPSLDDFKYDLGNVPSSGPYISNLQALKPLTTYYVRAYAINESDTVYGESEQFITGEPYTGSACPGQTTVTDADGNIYNTIKIGDQCWMAENLRVGIAIDINASPADNADMEKYCYDDNASNCGNYGGLYRWEEMMQYETISDKVAQGICPEGWHIPSDDEWKTLESYLGMNQSVLNNSGLRGAQQGAMLRAGGSSGFMALLGGLRTSTPEYSDIEKTGYYWSSTAYDHEYAWCRMIYSDTGSVGRYNRSKEQAMYVRCIKDTSSSPVIPQKPILITLKADSITQTTAVSGGNITDEGDAPVLARGVCWSLVSMPDLKTAMDSTSDGTGSESFSSRITGLSPENTYYVRAYARNIYGASYGDQISFTTLQDTTLPTVVTGNVDEITSTSATCGGDVTGEGGSSVTEKGVCLGFYPNLKLENAFDTISQGSGEGAYTCYLTNLLPDTMYYIRAYAINAAGPAYGALHNFRTDPLAGSDPVVDIEGNEYQTVTIGSQVWMAENLRTTKYADGTALISGSGDISGNYTSRYCFTYNDNASLAETYGRLYTWAAVMRGESAIDANPSGVQGVCPDGWHVPGDSEWKELESYLGMTFDLDIYGWRGTDQGTQLKEGGSSGFEATISGQRTYTGYYQDLDSFGKYWSTTDDLGTNAYYRQLDAGDTRVRRSAADKCYSLSVRCVKD